ncbi:MAG: radical SAM family heme chaperone HemW [Planctomycetota bacterium]
MPAATGATGRHLYIHIPFCVARCAYCDFASGVGSAELHHRYIDAVLRESEALPAGTWDTLYLGGGTPTALDPTALERLLAGLRRRHHPAPDHEWTCEANPGTLDPTCLTLLAEHGINRLSLGVQSLDDRQLRELGRIHDVATAHRAAAAARKRFPRVSADFLLALPGQTEAHLAAITAFAQEHALDHLSAYCLSIEPGTELARRSELGTYRIPQADAAADLLEAAWDRCEQAGYRQYETSNFALTGAASRHNLACWLRRDNHACGAAAVSCIGTCRTQRPTDPERYIAAITTGRTDGFSIELLDTASIVAETWMLGLRLTAGVSRAALAAVDDPPARWADVAAALADQGLVLLKPQHVALTRRGRLLQDAVTRAVMP